MPALVSVLYSQEMAATPQTQQRRSPTVTAGTGERRKARHKLRHASRMAAILQHRDTTKFTRAPGDCQGGHVEQGGWSGHKVN